MNLGAQIGAAVSFAVYPGVGLACCSPRWVLIAICVRRRCGGVGHVGVAMTGLGIHLAAFSALGTVTERGLWY